MRNIQVLAPAKKGECGVHRLNEQLQLALNPPARFSPQLTWGETVFRLGDKVIQTRNNYDLVWNRKTAAGWENGSGIFNGDIGFILQVDPGEHTLTVRFDEDRDVVYESADLEDLSLAYCLSVHKSQGSEFPGGDHARHRRPRHAPDPESVLHRSDPSPGPGGAGGHGGCHPDHGEKRSCRPPLYHPGPASQAVVTKGAIGRIDDKHLSLVCSLLSA